VRAQVVFVLWVGLGKELLAFTLLELICDALFIAIFKRLLSPFDCTYSAAGAVCDAAPEMAYWEGAHLVYVTAAALAFVTYLVCALVAKPILARRQSAIVFDPRANFYHTAARLAAVMAGQFFTHKPSLLLPLLLAANCVMLFNSLRGSCNIVSGARRRTKADVHTRDAA